MSKRESKREREGEREGERGTTVLYAGDLDLLTQAEAARIMGLTRQRVNQLIKEGKLPSYPAPLGERGGARVARIVAEEWPQVKHWNAQRYVEEIKRSREEREAEARARLELASILRSEREAAARDSASLWQTMRGQVRWAALRTRQTRRIRGQA